MVLTEKRRNANQAFPKPLNKSAVLFGRTGDGKSTVANALVTGGRGPVRFKTSDSAGGCTAAIQKETGRGWTVTDTVGIGTAKSVAVSNADANEMLTVFLKEVRDTYSHIIYVMKANRITTLDEMIWLIFVNVFRGAEEAFVVVITGASEEWLERYRDHLPEYLKDQSILVADIPPVHRRARVERKLKVIRQRSIETLEANLVQLFEGRGEGRKWCTPHIARMTDLELGQKSRTLVQLIIDTIKRLFEEISWESVASKLRPFANIVVTAGAISIQIVSMVLT